MGEGTGLFTTPNCHHDAGGKKGKKDREKEKKQAGELRRGRGREDGKRGEWGKVLEAHGVRGRDREKME